MSDAYVCEKCGEMKRGRPDENLSSGGYGSGMDVDLCGDCSSLFKKWLKRGVDDA